MIFIYYENSYKATLCHIIIILINIVQNINSTALTGFTAEFETFQNNWIHAV